MAITTPNKFAAPQMTYDILSRLALLNDRVFSAYVKQYPELGLQDSYIMKAEAAGASEYTPTRKWRQWRDNNRQGAAFQTTGAGTGSGAGAAVTVTLTAASHIQAGTLSPVSVGQVYEDDKDGIQYEVRAVNKTTAGAHTVTLAPTKASQTAAITTASLLKLQGRPSVKEASEQQEGTYYDWTSIQKETQTIRTNKAYTDLTMFEHLEIDGRTYYGIDRTNLDKEHVVEQELTLMFGDSKDNMTLASGNMNTAAKGVIPTIRTEGTDLSATTTLDDDYWKAIYRSTSANGYSSTYDVLHGPEFYLAYQDYLRANQPDYARIMLQVSDADREINAIFDFSDRVKIYGVDIQLKNYAFFNSQLMYGADLETGFWNNAAVFIPTGTHYNVAASDNLPHFRVRYQAEEAGGERTRLVTDGALLNPKGSTTMNAQLALVSYKGVEMYAPKAFMFAKATSV